MANKPLQIGEGQGNFRVGSVQARYKEKQVDMDVSPLASFLKETLPAAGQALGKKLQQDGIRAEIQGALDAGTNTNQLEEDNPSLKQYNWWLKDHYKNGYNVAAIKNEVVRIKEGQMSLAADAAKNGKSPEEYDQIALKESEARADRLSSLMADLPADQAKFIVDDLRVGGIVGRQAYLQASAARATLMKDDAMTKQSNLSKQQFEMYNRAGDLGGALEAAFSGLQNIWSADHIDKEEKIKRSTAYFTSLASSTSDPSVIDGLQARIDEELGVDALPVVKSLRAEFKLAGKRNEAKNLVAITEEINALEANPTEDSKDKAMAIMDNIMKLSESGVLSTANVMSLHSRLSNLGKDAKSKFQANELIDAGVPIETIAAAMGWSDADKSKALREMFPATHEGDAALMSYALKAKDYYSLNVATERMAGRLSNDIYGAVTASKDGEVPQEAVDSINNTLSTYNSLDGAGQSLFLGKLPTELRGIIEGTSAISPLNAGATVLDDLRKAIELKANPKYISGNVATLSSSVKGSKLTNYLAFGSEKDAQELAGSMAIKESLKKIAMEKPELTANIDLLEKAAIGDAKSRRVEFKTTNGDYVHMYTPVGKTLNDFFGEFTGSAEDFTQSISKHVNSFVDSQGGADQVFVSFGSGGTGQGINIVAYKGEKAISFNVTQDSLITGAKEIQSDNIAKAAKSGQNYAGVNYSTFADVFGKRSVSMKVSGSNKLGIDADVFNSIQSAMMEFEGFKSKPTVSKGVLSWGFGVTPESGNKEPTKPVTMEDASKELRGLLETNYIPMAQRSLKQYKVKGEESILPVMADLAYHGGNLSANKMAVALRDYQNWDNLPDDKKDLYMNPRQMVLSVLSEIPAFVQAQESRKSYLIKHTENWMNNNTNF